MRWLPLTGLLACATPQQVQVRVPVPILVTPDCEAPNVLERCRIECLPQQAHVAWESASAYRCYCKPWWDA